MDDISHRCLSSVWTQLELQIHVAYLHDTDVRITHPERVNTHARPYISDRMSAYPDTV